MRCSVLVLALWIKVGLRGILLGLFSDWRGLRRAAGTAKQQPRWSCAKEGMEGSSWATRRCGWKHQGAPTSE